MNCYKSGGCGVYENRSCDECPASKPEYLNKFYRENYQHGDVYKINDDNTLGEKIGTCSMVVGYDVNNVNALLSKLKYTEEKLDAAISDMKVWLAQGKTCQCCKYNFSDDDVSPCDQNGWVYGCSEFEWRGLPE